MEKIKNNLETFFTIWGIILVLNQVFIFGGCFAPYCLLAALPHTGIIAFFVAIFFIEDNKQSFNSSSNMHKIDRGCKEKVKDEMKQKLEYYRRIKNTNSDKYSARQSARTRDNIEMWLSSAETVLASLKKDDDCAAVKESIQHCFNEIEKIIK